MVEIQKARPEHLGAIIGLLADDKLGVTREDVRSPKAYEVAFEEINQDPNAQILVAMNKKKVVGCLQLNILANLSLTATKRGLIEGVRVAKTERGQGIATKLFEVAIEVCRENGCAMLQLTTNRERPDAAAFYQKLGFVGSHIGFKLMLSPKA